MAYRQQQQQPAAPESAAAGYGGGPPDPRQPPLQHHHQSQLSQSQLPHQHFHPPSNHGWGHSVPAPMQPYQGFPSPSAGGAGSAISTSYHAPPPGYSANQAGISSSPATHPLLSTSPSFNAPPPPPARVAPSGQAQPPRKRIAQSACETCRKKRTRCVVESNSVNGECNNCAALGIECVFSGVDKRKESVKDLRARVAYLEQLFGRLRAASSSSEVAQIMEEVRSDAALEGRLPVESSRDRAASSLSSLAAIRDTALSPGIKKRRVRYGETGIEFQSDGSDNDRSHPARATAAEAGLHQSGSDLSDSLVNGDDDFVNSQLTEMVDRLTVDNEGQIRAVGAISNAVFSGAVASATSPVSSPSNSSNNMAPSLAVRVRNFDGPGAVEGTPSAAIDTQAAVAALDYSVARISPSIPRSLIVELLNTYFIWYQCAFPIVSRQDFLASLAAGGEHFRPCLLNAVLALASQWSDNPQLRSDPADPHTAGNAFFQTAKELLDADFEQPSLGTVQALIVMASREHTCGHDSRGWVYNGIACRLSMDMGLHLDHTPLVRREVVSKRDAFIRSMVFWTTWYFDKEYCAFIGRPSAFKDIPISVPKYPQLAKDLECEELLKEQDLDWFASLKANRIVPLADGGPSAHSSVTVPRGVLHIAPLFVDIAAIFEDAIAVIYFQANMKGASASEGSRRLRDRLADLERTTNILNDYMNTKGMPSPTKEARIGADGQLDSPVPVQPFVLQLHFIYTAALIMYNRPYAFRQCPLAKRADHIPGKCQAGCRAPSDPMHPRSICFQAAVEQLNLVSLWQACSPRGLATANNTLQHSLFTAATVLIIESGGAQPSKLSRIDQERRTLARKLLRERVIPFFEALAVRRPAAKRSLDTMQELLLNREIEEQQKHGVLAQVSNALQGHANQAYAPSGGPGDSARQTQRTPNYSYGDFAATQLGQQQSGYTGGATVKLEEEQYALQWAAGHHGYLRGPSSTTPRASQQLSQHQPTQQWLETAGSHFPSYLQYSYGDPVQEAMAVPTSPVFIDETTSGDRQFSYQPQNGNILIGSGEAYQGTDGYYQTAQGPQPPRPDHRLPAEADYIRAQPQAMSQDGEGSPAFPMQATAIFPSVSNSYSQQQPQHRQSPQLSASPERQGHAFPPPHGAPHGPQHFQQQPRGHQQTQSFSYPTAHQHQQYRSEGYPQ